MPTFLREIFGVSQVALSYVVRYEPTSPVTVPSLQTNLIWSIENSIMMDELVDFTPHTGLSYEADNAQVYNLLAKSLVVTNFMTSITRHKRQRYEGSAHLDLVTHNVGSEK